MKRRAFLATSGALAAAPANAVEPVTAEVRAWNDKPTLFVRGKPVYAAFYALTDCPGGRMSFEEWPQRNIAAFAKLGFRLFQVDLFLEQVWAKEGPVDVTLAQRQIRGVLDVAPEAAVVIRWHVNAPQWWCDQHPDELTRYANGDLETPARTQPVRLIQDDLRRLKRASLASQRWLDMASAKTEELLQALAKTPEGAALAGMHVACGVYGEWHYWGFMRNEPDVSKPMQRRFDAWRAAHGRARVPVPSLEERRVTDDGIFRDPVKREAVIDYYRCQQDVVAEDILHLCRVVRNSWPRKILTGTFYGYFFSMFDRQATGGHLCLHKLLASPDVDYLSAPQAYGSIFRDVGRSGITRSLVETIRAHGKLFLDEMDQTPSWKWQNNVDQAFQLTDVAEDIGILRRNWLESFTRGMGLWFYDFGPSNQSGWWADTRLEAEIGRIKTLLERYHSRPYQPVADVVFIFDTEVYYHTGSVQGTDWFTDSVCVNRAIADAWLSGASIETMHLADLDRVDLTRVKVIVFANTWLLTAAQRRQIRALAVRPNLHLVFPGAPGYADGERLSVEFVREVTGMDVRRQDAPFALGGDRSFRPHFTGDGDAPGLVRKNNVWFSTVPPASPSAWREVFQACGAHIYVDGDCAVHAGGGLVLIHTKDASERVVRFRNGFSRSVKLPAKSSLVFDAATGELLLS